MFGIMTILGGLSAILMGVICSGNKRKALNVVPDSVRDAGVILILIGVGCFLAARFLR